MPSRSMRRAVRSAPAIAKGKEILSLITAPMMRKKLVAAAEAGFPPVTAISADLLEAVGPKTAKLPPIKRFAGLCVRALLEEEGFLQAARGVRMSNDPVFRTGSTYERAAVGKKASALLNRFIESLTDDEVDDAIILLRQRKSG
ncbi:MAG: hypothetical protein ACRECV_07420 [Xanthobacteraceae bacterium]